SPVSYKTLGSMRIVQDRDRLHFNHQMLFDQKVDEILPNHDAVVHDMDATLLINLKAGFTKFMRQRVFVHLLEKTGAQRVQNGKGTANDVRRKFIQLICVHSRSSTKIRVRPFFAVLTANDCQRVDASPGSSRAISSAQSHG